MDKGKYKMDALRTKNNGFRSPAFTIKVNGETLESTELNIQNLDVDLCADGSAGGCQFTISSEYNREKSEWLNKLADTIKVGARLEIKGGYVKKEAIFFGYVDDVSLDYSGRHPPSISVSGIDGFGFLMNCQEPIYGGQKKPQELVKEILEKAVTAKVAKSVTVGRIDSSTEAPVVPLIKEQIDDFKYLKLLAERYCRSLLCINGELIFDDVISDNTPLIELSAMYDVIYLSKRMSLHSQVGKMTVWGRDVNQKLIEGSAESVSLQGSGETAVEVATAFKKTARREYCEYVRTQAECQALAQARLNSLSLEYITGQGSCLGIPELIPGRYVTISNIDNSTKGSYFVTKVHHKFNNRGGYMTTFEFKGAKDK